MVVRRARVPEIDMLRVSKKLRNTRIKCNSFVLPIDLNYVDYGLNFRNETFYLLAQDVRDWYHDTYNKLHPVSYFQIASKGRPINKDNPQTQYCRQPNEWITESKPAIYPLPDLLRNPKRFPTPITMRGQYDKSSCMKYMDLVKNK